MFFYKEIQLILSRIEFSLLVRPSTTVPLSHVAPWGNELPTPALVSACSSEDEEDEEDEEDALVSVCSSEDEEDEEDALVSVCSLEDEEDEEDALVLLF